MELTTSVALTNVLICVFAMSSWLTVGGLWVEVPLFVKRLPEGIALPSYLALTIQLANVGPILYALVSKYLIPKSVRNTRTYECFTVTSMLTLGLVSCILLISLWDRVTYVNGVPRSVALLSLTTIMAVVDCTSSVIFLPFMARYPSRYMMSFYFGEGLSGLVPGIAGIIQGEEHNETSPSKPNESYSINISKITGLNFSLDTFFEFLALILLSSGIAFLCLNMVPSLRRVQIEPYDTINDDRMSRRESGIHDYNLLVDCDSISSVESELEIVPMVTNHKRELYILLAIIMWISYLGNGFLPSLQSYACLPYGVDAYSYGVKLPIIATPLAPLLMLRFKCSSDRLITILTLVVSAVAAYIVVVASLSHPPLEGTNIGTFLIVSSYILIAAISSFIKVNIASILSELGGYKELFWCGALTQLGSFLGAVTSYYLVNIAHVFHSN